MRLTIFKRLTFGYMVIMVPVVFLGIYVSLQLTQLNRLTRSVAATDETIIRPIEHLLDAVVSQVGFEKKFLISKDPDFFRRFDEIETRVTNDLKHLAEIVTTQKEKELFVVAKASYARYLGLFKEEVAIVRSDKVYAQDEFRIKKEAVVDELNQGLRDVTLLARSNRDSKIYTSSRISYDVLRVTTIAAALIIVLGLLISFYNTRTINRSILLLQRKTKEIAKGRFEEIKYIASPPEIKELADDFNIMCERLKELDEMKADFVSHVSHELRTPLTAIKEASSMLLEGTYKNAPEKEHELLSITKEECERLIDSVNRILDLSRMEANMMDYQFSEQRVAPVLRKTILKLAPIALRKKIHLRFEPQPKLPMVKMDDERIGQVLENLLGNALKFTAKGGRVVINVSLQETDPGSIVVSVADTGYGIPREDLEKIFHRFRRIESGKQTARGTGLGLSLAKYIVAAHGGKIWAQSEPEKGSIFFFTLPVSQ